MYLALVMIAQTMTIQQVLQPLLAPAVHYNAAWLQIHTPTFMPSPLTLEPR